MVRAHLAGYIAAIMETQAPPSPLCPRCGKLASLCVCAALEPVESRPFVLILQHPQEQDRDLGTGRLAHLQLARSALTIGLSWRSLPAALGREADPGRWGVLYLGPSQDLPADDIAVLDRHGAARPDGKAALAGLEGIVVLDGTWSQAKALWWRNPWLLKLHRIVLRPGFRSAYGELRREPRPESVSTIEAVALCLAGMEGEPELFDRIAAPFRALIAAHRAGAKPAAARPPRRPDRRRARPGGRRER
jgi:tRNA-uridine aminocarboxypropyltransferase